MGMRHSPSNHHATKLAILLTVAAPACVSDSAPPEVRTERAEPSGSPGRDDSAASPSAAPVRGASTAAPAAQPSPSASAPTPGTAGTGACDLSGQWLITQRTIASGLGVKQRVAWWFYYDLEQQGSELRVNEGLVCGSQVFPVDPLSAAVEFDASFPALIENNSHVGRRGTVVDDGEGCSVSFERAVVVVGATTPFYTDESNPLPALDQPASDTAPGWEDWDEDGNPAVSLHVSGLIEGSRYTVIRAFSEWSGTVVKGATAFQLDVSDWGQDEAVLGVTAELLKQTGVPDPDRSGHFTEFARLAPEQVRGDASAICATVRELAPTLTPDANR